MDQFFESNPPCVKTTKKCVAWAKLKVKNQKESSVNQSNKEANSNKQEGCTQKLGKNNVLKLSFLNLFLV